MVYGHISENVLCQPVSMLDLNLMPTHQIQTHQIVYLEHGEERLYAEVIQVISQRSTCWARPLAIVVASQFVPLANDSLDKATISSPKLHNLRYASDLLLPIALFRPALDVDILPWLGQIYEDSYQPLGKEDSTAKTTAQYRLNQFIHAIWQAYPEQFQAGNNYY